MGFMKQTIICIAIGLICLACNTSDNVIVSKYTEKVEKAVFQDYSASDIKTASINTIKNVSEFKDKLTEAIEYTEETMANYRKDVL